MQVMAAGEASQRLVWRASSSPTWCAQQGDAGRGSRRAWTPCVQKSETGVLFREIFSDGMSCGGGFLRAVAEEVEGLEPLRHKERPWKPRLRVLGAVPRLLMGSLSPQTRGDKNGTDYQVEEEEEDSG